ncbi:hypothetical protein KSS89_25675 [Pseudomonas sessilinigenes]|uniref:Zinc finger RING-type eukaryotic domain-containing protein n=1 Tax=Pseudomonas sessilinigenes TaxID=658629 RepID=A0ABX8MX79_9PSED|nr:hypothetical protein ATY02_28950 [Pseudomonas sp. BIOMIG1BAC]QXH43851.1 hypothetical protein KSS89_25675 [Pseudomonas sessilinigenes]UMZ15378.1 hypothetical protein I9018_25610 [Pseudomonas sp. MPFS]
MVSLRGCGHSFCLRCLNAGTSNNRGWP